MAQAILGIIGWHNTQYSVQCTVYSVHSIFIFCSIFPCFFSPVVPCLVGNLPPINLYYLDHRFYMPIYFQDILGKEPRIKVKIVQNRQIKWKCILLQIKNNKKSCKRLLGNCMNTYFPIIMSSRKGWKGKKVFLLLTTLEIFNCCDDFWIFLQVIIEPSD